MHWTVGKVKITKVVELETVGSTRFILPLATNEEIQKLPWLIPHFANEEGRLKMSIHSLMVETPTRRIIVDTGLGNDKQGRNVPIWNNPAFSTLTRRVLSLSSTRCSVRNCSTFGWNTKHVGESVGTTFRRPLRVPRPNEWRTCAMPYRRTVSCYHRSQNADCSRSARCGPVCHYPIRCRR